MQGVCCKDKFQTAEHTLKPAIRHIWKFQFHSTVSNRAFHMVDLDRPPCHDVLYSYYLFLLFYMSHKQAFYQPLLRKGNTQVDIHF